MWKSYALELVVSSPPLILIIECKDEVSFIYNEKRSNLRLKEMNVW